MICNTITNADLAAKLAGIGLINPLALPWRWKHMGKTLLSIGAAEYIEPDQNSKGVIVENIDESREIDAATNE